MYVQSFSVIVPCVQQSKKEQEKKPDDAVVVDDLARASEAPKACSRDSGLLILILILVLIFLKLSTMRLGVQNPM